MRIRGVFRPPVSRAGTIARRGLSGIECRPVQRVQRPGVCRALHGLPWYLPALVLARSALPLVACRRSGCAGVQGAPAGYVAAAQPRPVSLSTTEKIKKAQKKHPTPYCQSQKFRKNKKDPYKGSVFCAILALQALKGRNLQWLKVK